MLHELLVALLGHPGDLIVRVEDPLFPQRSTMCVAPDVPFVQEAERCRLNELVRRPTATRRPFFRTTPPVTPRRVGPSLRTAPNRAGGGQVRVPPHTHGERVVVIPPHYFDVARQQRGRRGGGGEGSG